MPLSVTYAINRVTMDSLYPVASMSSGRIINGHSFSKVLLDDDTTQVSSLYYCA